MITVIETGNVCPVVMSKAGSMTTISVALTETTNASFAGTPAPGSNSTRTGSRKLVPLIVTRCPPLGRPVAGETLVMVGLFAGGVPPPPLGENVTVIDFWVLPTVASTVAVPAAADVSVAVATPAVVVFTVRLEPVSVNVPRLVLNSTAVPLGTG